MTPASDLLRPRQFDALVASAAVGDVEIQRLLPFVFHLLPGAQDVAERFAAYLVDLPTPCLQHTLFGRALTNAVHALNSVGIVPWTTNAHRSGFALFVGALLSNVTDIARLRVSFDCGSVWRAQDGPFLAHHQRQGRSVSFLDLDPTRSDFLALRVNLLTYLISSTDLPRLGANWRLILSPADDHAS